MEAQFCPKTIDDFKKNIYDKAYVSLSETVYQAVLQAGEAIGGNACTSLKATQSENSNYIEDVFNFERRKCKNEKK